MVDIEKDGFGQTGARLPSGAEAHARLRHHLRPVLIAGAALLTTGCTVAFALGGGAAAGPPMRAAAHRSARIASPAAASKRAAAPVATASTVPATRSAQAARVAAVPVVATATTAPAPTTTTQASATTTVATLVAQVESAGIDPGATWSWSMGSTTVGCGAIRGDGSATGCTSWSSGVVRTVFTGSPALSLVAHEVANAEVEADATPALLSRVATEAGSSSWSATDAVASCLVVHAFGWQDGAAGPWQCPTSLASYVAAHIHDTVVTITTTAICGSASGISSTLSFQAGDGTLTLTGPSGAPAQVVGAGGTLTSSGVGTFTAVDVGATPVVSGTCEG